MARRKTKMKKDNKAFTPSVKDILSSKSERKYPTSYPTNYSPNPVGEIPLGNDIPPQYVEEVPVHDELFTEEPLPIVGKNAPSPYLTKSSARGYMGTTRNASPKTYFSEYHKDAAPVQNAPIATSEEAEAHGFPSDGFPPDDEVTLQQMAGIGSPAYSDNIKAWSDGSMKSVIRERDVAVDYAVTEESEILRRSLQIGTSDGRTGVVAVAVDLENKENKTLQVKCTGEPMRGYTYDTNHDVYLITGKDVLNLGYVPIAYRIGVLNSGNWCSHIPLPEEVIENHLSPSQKKQLKYFREKYKTPKHTIHFVQTIM